jgi:hypothetical protein
VAGWRVALVRHQDIEAVADGDAGGEDQEVIDVAGVVAVFAPVEVVVEDQAGHDHGLAAAGGHLEGHPGQMAGGVVAGVACRCRNWVWRCVPVFDFSATSLSQIAASTASCWAKNSF